MRIFDRIDSGARMTCLVLCLFLLRVYQTNPSARKQFCACFLMRCSCLAEALGTQLNWRNSLMPPHVGSAVCAFLIVPDSSSRAATVFLDKASATVFSLPSL